MATDKMLAMWHPEMIVASETHITLFFVVALVFSLAILSTLPFPKKNGKFGTVFDSPFLRFVYASFLKPHSAKVGDGQQSALESFYSAQASVYDATRKRLLCGREDMLGIVAAQLQTRNQTVTTRKPIWFDVGGGTGYNIEVMDKLVNIQSFFDHVYLIDLSPSLCEVARQRVKQFNWTNVTILCQDARTLQSQGVKADLITMSYSLSMIPDFYSVVDLLTGLLSPDGLIGICDFYVQSIVDVSSRNYTGGVINRHVNWFGRMFWRTWFDADRVNLDAGRRDYVEYRFGTIISASERNYLLGGIPYYIFVGCCKEADTTLKRSYENIHKLDAALTESPYLSAKDYQQRTSAEAQEAIPHSKFYDSAIVNLTSNLPLPAAFYQQHHWRIHYNDLLAKHQQFKDEYIYAFNWEDPKVDRQLLDINSQDVILTITSAGDNILDYLLESPKRVHAVDLNPNQNHLLELKCAAFTTLSYSECWALFADGICPNFRDVLIHKLSPHLSSPAFQYWLSHTSTFAPSSVGGSGGLYQTGGSRHAIKMIRWLFRIFGLTSKVRTFCAVDTLNEQREIWPAIRDVLLSWPLHWAIVSTEWWSWKAAGVPKEQRQLIIDDFEKSQRSKSVSSASSKKAASGEAIWRYVVDTLDPVVENTQISRENYFYYVCMQGKYSKRCHPRYLGQKAFAKLSRPQAFDGLRIHTDELMEVISRIAPGSLTIAILMDSMDWFTPPEEASPPPPSSPNSPSTTSDSSASPVISKVKRTTTTSKSTQGTSAALNQILALHRVLKPGGRVLFRSASLRPWYADIFERNGFEVRCVAARHSGRCIDRVNMYASTYICTKLNADGTVPLPRVRSEGTMSSSSSSSRGSPRVPGVVTKRRGASGSVSSGEGSFDECEEGYRGRDISPRLTQSSKRFADGLRDLDLGPPGLES